MSVETTLKFIQQGIVYDDLSDEDKEIYEDTFKDENGELPESIASSALNEWIFNEDTIREVLHILMTHGLKIDYGNKMGKTILFARSHTHAEKILEVFGKEYPHLNEGYPVGQSPVFVGILRFHFDCQDWLTRSHVRTH